jgi:hypothetical protein
VEERIWARNDDMTGIKDMGEMQEKVRKENKRMKSEKKIEATTKGEDTIFHKALKMCKY